MADVIPDQADPAEASSLAGGEALEVRANSGGAAHLQGGGCHQLWQKHFLWGEKLLFYQRKASVLLVPKVRVFMCPRKMKENNYLFEPQL